MVNNIEQNTKKETGSEQDLGTKKTISRRNFLKAAGFAGVGAALVACGATAPSRAPTGVTKESTPIPEIGVPFIWKDLPDGSSIASLSDGFKLNGEIPTDYKKAPQARALVGTLQNWYEDYEIDTTKTEPSSIDLSYISIQNPQSNFSSEFAAIPYPENFPPLSHNLVDTVYMLAYPNTDNSVSLKKGIWAKGVDATGRIGYTLSVADEADGIVKPSSNILFAIAQVETGSNTYGIAVVNPVTNSQQLYQTNTDNPDIFTLESLFQIPVAKAQEPTQTETAIVTATATIVASRTPTPEPTVTATAQPTSTPEPTATATEAPPTPTPEILQNLPLRELASRKGIEVGAMLTASYIQRYPELAKVFSREFNLGVMNWELNWATGSSTPFLRPAQDEYNFSQVDKFVEFAKEHNMNVQGQHLLWGLKWALPDWLQKGGFSKDELISVIQDHIKQVVGRYNEQSEVGQINEWVVVNELFGNLNEKSFWHEKFGNDYSWVDTAFRTAREANPKAKLILNDFLIEWGGRKANDLYQVVKKLKESGTPIDAVGFQFHIMARDYLKGGNRVQQMISSIKRFQELGVEIMVTEFDVALDGIKGENKYEVQSNIYKEVLRTCIDSGVKSCAFFGVTDKFAWTKDSGRPDADPLLFDSFLKPKPAYQAVKEVLSA